jgi:hypothetical protein
MTDITLLSLPTLFPAALLCTTSVLKYLLLPQMKQGKIYNKIKTYGPLQNAKYVDRFTVNTSVKVIRNSQQMNETNKTKFTIKHNKF